MRDHAVAGLQNRRAAQATGFFRVRHALDGLAADGGVGGDDAVHAVALERGGDEGDLRLVQIGGDLHENRNAALVLGGQLFAAF